MGLPAINLISPADLATTEFSICAFDISYADYTDEFVANIVVEVDTVNTFDSANKKTSVFTDIAHNSNCKSALILDLGTWYWRATATNNTGSTVTDTRTFEIGTSTKRALHIYENIKKNGPDWSKKRILHLYENIAKKDIWTKKRALYEYENITDEPPFPTIYRISVTRTVRGGIVTLYGTGFGYKPETDTTNEDRFKRGYGGYVYIGGYTCGIISWSWTEITFSVPNDAISGAVKVRLTKPDEVRDSNLVGLEVYETEPSEDIGIEFFLCDRENPNTIVRQLHLSTNKSFQTLLNNPGSGAFNMTEADSVGVKDQDFVLVKLDGVDVFKWIIENRNPNKINSSELPTVSFSGRGLLSILERAVVYPEGMPTPTSLERTWNGVHAAQILRQLILEAQGRGTLLGLSMDWTADADCIGAPWTDITDISFHAGTPLLDVIMKLSNAMGIFDVEITPNMTLKLYKSKGEDLSGVVRYFPGQAMLSSELKYNATEMTNVVLVEGEDGSIAEVVHPGNGVDWGRREGYLQARNIPAEWAKLETYGNIYLKNASQVSWGIQGKVVGFNNFMGKLKPFDTYILGDIINWYIPERDGIPELNENLRVKGVTVEEDENGQVTYTLDLNNLILEREIKVNQMLQRQSMFSKDAVLSSPSTAPKANADHNHTHSNLLGLDSDDHTQYYNQQRHTSDPHTNIQRVSSLKKNGEDSLTGEVTLEAGNNVTIVQNNANKTIRINATGGGGGGEGIGIGVAMGGNAVSSGRTERGYGLRFMALVDCEIAGGFFYTTWDNGIVYTCKLWDTSNNVLASGVITGDGSTSWRDVDFATPYKVEKFKEYHISIEKPSGNIGKWYETLIFPFARMVQSYTGLPGNINNAVDNYALGINILL